MTRKIQIFILFLLIAFINNPVDAFAGMGGSQNSTQLTNLTNTTESDQDIALVQHLIDITQSENDLSVAETLVFKNVGTKNYSGTLSAWVPDDAANIGIAKIEMMTEAPPSPLQYAVEKVQKGNITIWSADIRTNDYPMYLILYQIPQKQYSKILLYPTRTKQPLSFIIKLNLNNGSTASITDGNGNDIMASAITSEEFKGSYRWENPEFTEINIALKNSLPIAASSGNSNVGLYIVLGFLIILALSYPVLRKKSDKILDIENQIKNSFRRNKPDADKQETEDEEVDEMGSENAETDSQEDVANVDLETEKDELLSKLGALDKKYASGDLMDEEYDELRRPYQQRLKQIKKLIGS